MAGAPAAQRQRILEVRDLSVRFTSDGATVRVVNGVSFHVDEGEAVGIVGESGSGKSVTALSVMGLVKRPPAVVSVESLRFRGKPLDIGSFRAMSRVRGREMAMIFQDPMTSLNPVLNVELQLREVLEHHLKLSRRAARERSIELLRMVGIPGAEHRLSDYPHQFSGGMRQRVMIAMALACEPKLLIADEPTTALDVTVQASIVELVGRLREQLGLAVVWITHDLGLLARFVDRVVVMYGGRVVEEAEVDVAYGMPRHPYTIGLLQSVPTPRTERGKPLRTIRGTPPDPKANITACPFMPRCDYAIEECEVNPPLEEHDPGHRVACWVRPDGAAALAEWRGEAPAAAATRGGRK